MNLNNRPYPVIALAGNPNVGKTSLFNALTGLRQTVGNWPGVTVEHKSGFYLYHGIRYEVIDLPGIYSLSGGTPDELVARDYILNEKPDLIINIVDASNLERNLYLSVQMMELGAPLLMCLSMTDIADQNGIMIEIPHLAAHLGFDVIPVILNKRFDPEPLRLSIQKNLETPGIPAQIHYDEVVENHLDEIWKEILVERPVTESAIPAEIYAQVLHARWHALKLIEGDPV
ncbi:MAG TPA: FeoB small GTPase domain-containing protein, partial [Candidatus Cloacimonadota bacterium]|nr:FeoB small GTPase domain-containing protein [Candidatus Cloacimonadota bacterium]